MMTSNMMNNVSNVTVDSLSYKELQGLAMSLNLPGKMKQGVLVEAIKARQNHNEQAVTMILEANRQRRIARRQQQQQLQQQQLLKLKTEKDVNNKRKNVVRSRIKRSASEMEMDTFIDEEGYKRSKLTVASATLIQQQQQHRPAYFTSLTTGATSLTIRKDQQLYQTGPLGPSGCSTWDQHPIIESSAVPPPIAQKPLPDLSKELSILPTLSDCSNSSAPTPSTSEDLGCCSVGSSSWSSLSGTGEQQSLPQSSFEGCDPAWMSTDDPYESLNTWKNIPNLNKIVNNNSGSNGNGYDNIAPPSNSSSGYFEDNQSSDMFVNNNANNNDIYRPDDFINNNSSNNNTSVVSNNYVDYQIQSQTNSMETPFTTQDIKSDPSSWCESYMPQYQQNQSQQQQQQSQQSSPCANIESRIPNDCCLDADCYQLGGPHFRIQRPGNPTAVFVPSGRGLTLPTFCNMLPRVASYAQ